ncbi:ADAMTS-like protein 5 isoform X4 [Hemibagrus wyckioides]|uniref:ADAMTS-like protein 5 isoform X4 n=1 Tax=Hemibagrus wyckioides TaxID=337641 RepID=UPI00266CD3FD|nr:ADAMTS-like protein 5 isoform X4 [Hemibagrus wyckioides]
MPEQHCRKLSLFQALTLVMLLTSPDCLSSQQTRGKRVGRSSRVPRQLFNNEWASWGVWSECSRSCGGGASIRRRTCIYRNPVGASCLGDPRQYKICNTKKPGCDLIFGSQQQEDACMVCGGQNTTCLHHRSVYRSIGQDIGPFGYNEVTMIPAGATHIRVTDNSKNYLALQNGRSQFVINGNWKISVPGEYNVAGTKLLYRRSADTWESFEVPGPTQEDLHIMVLSTDKNSGIEYEYWLPPELYALHHGRQNPYRHHHTSNFLPWDLPPTTTTTTRPPATTQPSWGPAGGRRPHVRPPFQQQPLPRLERDEKSNYLPRTHSTGYCGKCRRVKGRGERQRQYCQKDYVFRAKILGKVYLGEETRYDVQIIHTYRNRFHLERREYLWAPNRCDCPALEDGYQYVLMVRRHVNHEQTLDRILLEEDSYAQLYRPREDSLLRPLENLCSNRGLRTRHRV